MAKDGWRNLNAAHMQGGAILPSQIPTHQIIETLRAEPEDAEVYFARRGDFIKIGCTRNLKKRLTALKYYRDPAGQIGPMRLLLATAGGRATEGYYHSRFSASSVDGYGEWFHADLDVLGFVLRVLRCEAKMQTPEGRSDVERELRMMLEEMRDGVHA